MKRKIITIIIALILGVVTAQADILKGRVVDAETGEPLEGVQPVSNEYRGHSARGIYLSSKEN